MSLSFSHTIQLSALRLLGKGFTALGFAGIHRIAGVLGAVLWYCLPGRRREAVQRIQEHLGLSRHEAVCAARASFTNNAMSFLEIFLVPKLLGVTDPRLRDNEDKERFLRLIAGAERPVIAALAHFGSWELLASLKWENKDRPLLTVVRQHKNPAMNTLIHELRGARGMTSLDHRNVSVSVLDLLRQGGVAAFLVDHNCRRRDAVFLPFLGKIAAVNKGPALLAVRAKAIVYPLYLERHEDQTYSMIMGQGLDTAELDGSLSDRVSAVAEFYTKAVEEQVRRKPEQWFWMHRRWKTRPEDEEAR